jgi:hypothetical protein
MNKLIIGLSVAALLVLGGLFIDKREQIIVGGPSFSLFKNATTTGLTADYICLGGTCQTSFAAGAQDGTFSTSSAIYFVHSSTTIPKTYTANTWSLSQTFSVAPVLSTIASAILGTNSSGTVIATTTPTATVFNATNASATSTFAGNMWVKGNLRVDGTFFAPVQIVSSGNATINGALAVTGQTTLATSLTGFVTAASGVLSATAAGGTNHVLYSTAANTPASEAALTYLASGDLLTMVNASTTNGSFSQSLFAADASSTVRRVTGSRPLSFNLATSTTWTGTSSATTVYGDGGTIYAPFSGIITSLQCGTNAGTLGVLLTSRGSTVYLSASTTANMNTVSLALAKGAPLTIVGGTPASSPTTASCTLIAQEN